MKKLSACLRDNRGGIKEYVYGGIGLGSVAFIALMFGGFCIAGLNYMGIAPFGLQFLSVADVDGGGGLWQPKVTTTAPTSTTVPGLGKDVSYYIYARVFNSENTTGVEWFSADMKIVDQPCDKWETGLVIGSITTVVQSDFNTTARAEVNYGKTYCLIPLAADGASGDNSKVKSAVITNSQGKVVDGKIEVTVTNDLTYVTVGLPQHATLEFRAYDKAHSTYVYHDQDNDSTNVGNTWATTGVAFESNTNGTALAIGSSDYLNVRYEVRAVQDDTTFTDYETVILADLDISDWNTPSVTINDAVAVDIADAAFDAGGLNGDETKAYSTYEYAYKTSLPLARAITNVEVNVDPASGVNPDMDPVLAFASRGTFESINAGKLGIGTVKDNSARTQVFTLQTLTHDIS